MKPRVRGAWLVGVALAALLGSTRVFAISPALVMVYGHTLPAPVVIDLKGTIGLNEFLWNTRVRGAFNYETHSGTMPAGLKDRPYFRLAVFWGRYDVATLKPEQASQHGRLYLATASEPAVIVATLPHMAMEPRPMPADLKGFHGGWVLNAGDLANAKRMGIPGL